jgi:hypothetical protein
VTMTDPPLLAVIGPLLSSTLLNFGGTAFPR